MPPFVFNAGLKPALHQSHGSQPASQQPALAKISLLLLGLASAGLLAGCGSDTPTTRINDNSNLNAPAEETYTLTVSSPVALENVAVTLTDTMNGTQLGKQVIASGTETSFSFKKSDVAGRHILATLTGQSPTSRYFDPALLAMAPFTPATTLHANFIMQSASTTVSISPFTDIAYQRTLVRANSLDPKAPDLTRLDPQRLAGASQTAAQEVATVFQVLPSMVSPAIASADDLRKMNINSTGVIKPYNTTLQYLNTFYSIGHYLVQKTADPKDATPYLSFALRAGEDMRDGSLDGMGIAGTGNTLNGTVYLKNPLVQAVLNTDPNKNSQLDLFEQQKATQAEYAERLKQSLLHYLGNALKHPDQAGINYFNTLNYSTGTSTDPSLNGTQPSPFGIHSIGAGNYKRAFGLGQIPLKTTSQPILKNLLVNGQMQDCTPQNFVDPEADKAGHTPRFERVDCTIGVNAQGDTRTFGGIDNLVGIHTTVDNSCKVTVFADGTVTLQKGSQSYSNTLSRQEEDSLIRLTPLPASDQEKYILNIAASNQTPVSLIQLRIENQEIVAAAAGLLTKSHPRQLDNPVLVCENFKPILTRPQ